MNGTALVFGTMVPTLTGQTPVERLVKGDLVYDRYGDVCKVLGISDIGSEGVVVELKVNNHWSEKRGKFFRFRISALSQIMLYMDGSVGVMPAYGLVKHFMNGKRMIMPGFNKQHWDVSGVWLDRRVKNHAIVQCESGSFLLHMDKFKPRIEWDGAPSLLCLSCKNGV